VPEVVDGRGENGQRDAVGGKVIAAGARDAKLAEHGEAGDQIRADGIS
jgi:hypothetical protein